MTNICILKLDVWGTVPLKLLKDKQFTQFFSLQCEVKYQDHSTRMQLRVAQRLSYRHTETISALS